LEPMDDLSQVIATVGNDPLRFGFDLYSTSSILDMNIGYLMVTDEGEGISLQFDIESSDDMENWFLEETILRDIDMSGGKVFLRLDYGPQKAEP